METASHPALAAGAHPFPHSHLLNLSALKPWEMLFLMDEAEQWVALNRGKAKHDTRLAGLTQINAFFENSTRTLLSFEIAGKRLGADVVNLGVQGSSVKKGETLLDTALTLNAMHPDVLVIRHGASGAVQLIAEKVDCPVLNAGDGRHEHPTQALLDGLTIRRQQGADCGPDGRHLRRHPAFAGGAVELPAARVAGCQRARRGAADADAGQYRGTWASSRSTTWRPG